MTRGKVTTLLLETLVHVMRGSGFPTAASQFRVTLSASVTLWLPDILVMAGGTEKKKQNRTDTSKMNLQARDI